MFYYSIIRFLVCLILGRSGFSLKVKGFEMCYLLDSFSVLMNWLLVLLSM